MTKAIRNFSITMMSIGILLSIVSCSRWGTVIDGPAKPMVQEEQKDTSQASGKLSDLSKAENARADKIDSHADNISSSAPTEIKPKIDPEIKGIKEETKGMRADAGEIKALSDKLKEISAKLGVEQKKIEDYEKAMKDSQKTIIDLKNKIITLENENTRLIKNMLAWLSVLCVVGIGASLFIGFILKTPSAFLMAAGCALTLGVSLAVTMYMHTIGLVAISCMGVGVLGACVYVVMQMLHREKAVKELVKTNEITKQNMSTTARQKVFGNGAEPGLVEHIQSPATKQLVAKIRTLAKKADVHLAGTTVSPPMDTNTKPPQ